LIGYDRRQYATPRRANQRPAGARGAGQENSLAIIGLPNRRSFPVGLKKPAAWNIGFPDRVQWGIDF
jgi:hypothetical protein